MLAHPLHQGHADNATGGRAEEGTGLPGMGVSTAKEKREIHQLSDQLPEVTAPSAKGRGVFKAALTAVIPAETIWKGAKPPPEQFRGHSNMPWSQQCKEHSDSHLHQHIRSVTYLG